jgi:hypothetical protein
MIVFRSAAQARIEFDRAFPQLAARTDWRIKSPWDDSYQCIAWAACRTDHVWWPWDHPRFYWPPGYHRFPVYSPVPVDAFVEVFEQEFGYQQCGSRNFEFGYQKVAIFANALGATHMSRQRFFGRGWLSKAGCMEDIVHCDLTDVQGHMAAAANTYGEVAQVMKRSWWAALIRLCLFRCWWSILRFWLYRRLIS